MRNNLLLGKKCNIPKNGEWLIKESNLNHTTSICTQEEEKKLLKLIKSNFSQN
jgi:hypothetical protein